VDPSNTNLLEKEAGLPVSHPLLNHHMYQSSTPPTPAPTHTHQSGKESALIVERYGGNMMSLHAEPSVVGAGDGPVPPESELSFQTHVMKVCGRACLSACVGVHLPCVCETILPDFVMKVVCMCVCVC